ncbi:MAG: hypothetical protein J7K68_00775 [Candidatus Diapherotrites archaeon]|nr:hypothetical protein [Candidatus Diapherotrites archaeon]
MDKGVSPIVAVVLLIAIAVIAAVGLYFWVGGLATKQPTGAAPRTITVYAIACGQLEDSNAQNYNYTSIMIVNTSPPGTQAIAPAYDLAIAGVSGAVFNSSSCGSTTTLDPGEQAVCRIYGYNKGDGALVVYGKANKKISSATIEC